MDYTEFAEVIIERLRIFYSDRAKVELKTVTKNNNVCLDGLNIQFEREDNKIVPIIYLNPYYDRYLAESSIEDIIEEIIKLRAKHSNPDIDYDHVLKLTNWDSVKDFIYPRLVCTETNDKLLNTCIHKSFLDLSIVYSISVMSNESEGFGSVKVTTELFENWGISENTLHEQAIINLKKQGYTIKDIADVVSEIIDGNVMSQETILESGSMYVLSNNSQLYGAASLLNPDFLRETTRSCWVIPSSIHEVILLPNGEDDTDANSENLDALIKEVNTNIDPEEVLSQHCYYFDFDNKEIRIHK